MKKYLPIVLILSLTKLLIHLVANRNYGFQRDELLHLSVSEHLAWGYMEFPPFIAVVGKLAHFLFGYSLSGVRLFSTLAGVAILILCCLIAKELGGKRNAIMLAGVSVLAFLPFFRNHTLFQPVAFDQFFWTLAFYFLIKYFNTKNERFLVWLGITAGLGLMNKYTFVVWGLGVVIGLMFFEKGKLFKNKWLHVSGIIALLMVLPNIIWQAKHHFPLLMHLRQLKESQLDEMGPYDFALEQLKFPFTLLISLIGLFASFFDTELRKYKSIGIAVLVVFFAMWLLQSKAYYFFVIYPVLFALGAVKIEKLLSRKPIWNYAVVLVLIVPVIYFIPMATPVLPIDTFVHYAKLQPEKDGRIILTDDYADMFGWEEQVKLADSLYNSLSKPDKEKCIFLAENYGEAGALKILGDKYNLPDPVSRHGSFWTWGPGDKKGDVCISIGNEEEVVRKLFEDCKQIKIITHKYAIDEENNIPVYVCRKPKKDLQQLWPELEQYIFE
ncbi:glycosyltransferase family 39 protein [Flavobacterium enshiense]|uniref:ArnT family glycosyltransferase n=1 Tax=Flavobacterium enshiense TaxID=1341165 RepID=UPI00345D09E4